LPETLPPEAPQEQPDSFPRKNLRAVVEFIEMVLIAVVLYFMIDSVVARVRVQKISMEPTLVPGEVLLVNKLAYTFGDIEYGDIITFHYPLDQSLDYVKRVIGKEGDIVVVEGGEVYVNNILLEEPYISAPPEYMGVWEVPQDALFVLGDNRNPSADSHVWGYVPLDNVIGKAFAVYWPLDQVRALQHTDIFAGS